MKRLVMRACGFAIAAGAGCSPGGGLLLAAGAAAVLSWPHRPREVRLVAAIWLLAGALAGLGAVAVGNANRVTPLEEIPTYGGLLEVVTPSERGTDAASWRGIAAGHGRVEARSRASREIELLPGDRIAFLGRLGPAHRAANPHGFDYAAHLAARGIRGTAVVNHLVLMGPNPTPTQTLIRPIARWRCRVDGWLDRSGLPQETAGIMAALAIGNQRRLPDSTRRRYATAGVAHLLAVSGLHLGCLAYAVLRVLQAALRRLLPGRADRMPFVAAWGAGACFLAASGGPTSCVRAFIMLTGFTAARVLRKDYDLWTWLAAASLAILAVRPAALGEAGFQLSTTSVAAILLVTARPRRGKGPESAPTPLASLGSRIAEMARVSASAWAGTMPFAWWHFGVVALAAVPCNLLFVPIVSLWVLPLVLTAALLVPVEENLPFLLIRLSHETLFILDAILDPLLQLVGEGTRPWPGPAVAAGTALALLGALCLRRRLPSLLLAAVALVLLLVGGRPSGNDGFQVTWFHVGAGDMTLAQGECGESILIDGGPAGSGARVLGPCIRRRGTEQVDLLVLTHGHADHYAGLLDPELRLRICEVWVNGSRPSLEAAARIMAHHRGCGGEDRPVVRTVARGERWNRCATSVTVLWPGRGEAEHLSENDRSIVVEMEHRDGTFLHGADVEGKKAVICGEERTGVVEMLEALLPRRRAPPLVVKVPHHGRRSPLLVPLLGRTGALVNFVPCGGRGLWDAGLEAGRWLGGTGLTWLSCRDGALEVERSDGRWNFVFR
jgi:competence protein ComEC